MQNCRHIMISDVLQALSGKFDNCDKMLKMDCYKFSVESTIFIIKMNARNQASFNIS